MIPNTNVQCITLDNGLFLLRARVAQRNEASDLKSLQRGFESHLGYCGHSSAVEPLPSKQAVVGSNPIVRFHSDHRFKSD